MGFGRAAIKHGGLFSTISCKSFGLFLEEAGGEWCQVTNYSLFVFCLHKSIMLPILFSLSIALCLCITFSARGLLYTLIHCNGGGVGPINQTDRQSVNISSPKLVFLL